MTPFRTGLSLVCVLLLPLVLFGQAEPPKPVDAHGDPLPRFVRLRIGTIRFRQGSQVTSLRYATDGKVLISAGADMSLRMWDPMTGRELAVFGTGARQPSAGALDGIECGLAFRNPYNQTAWMLSPDGKVLATMDGAGFIRLWDVACGKQLHQLGQSQNRGNNAFLAFSPDGKLFAAVGNENKNNNYYGVIRVWEVGSGKEVKVLAGPEPKKADEQRFYPNNVTFSPDGKFIASTGFEGRRGDAVRLWDVENGKALPPLATPPGGFNFGELLESIFDGGAEYSNFIGAPIFSPDGKYLTGAIQSRRGQKLHLWDPISGKHIRELGEHPSGINYLVWAPNSKALAVLSGDQTVHLWNPANGKELPAIGGGNGGTFALVFSPDGKTLAIGNSDQTIRLFDTASAKEKQALHGYQGAYGHLNLYQMNQGLGANIAFSPDGKTVAASGGSLIRLWDVGTGKEIRPVEGGPDTGVQCLSVSPDGKVLATLGDNGQVVLWDAAAGKELRRLEAPKAEGEDAGPAAAVAAPYYGGVASSGVTLTFSPDGKLLAGSYSDGSIALWDVETGKALHRLKGHDFGFASLSFSANGKYLASGGNDGRVLWWDTATGKHVRQFAGPPAGADPTPGVNPDNPYDRPGPAFVAVSPDGRLLAASTTVNQEGRIQLYEVSSGKLRRSIPIPGAMNGFDNDLVFTRFGYVNRNGMALTVLTFSPDGRTLAWSTGTSLRLWDVLRGKELRQFGGQDGMIAAASFSRDGKHLAAACADGSVRLWDVHSGTVLTQLRGHRGSVSTLTFIGDGKTLASSGADTTILLWEVPAALADETGPALSEKELTQLWQQFGTDDAAKADEIRGKLIEAPKEAVAWLRKRTAPAARLDPEKLDKLLADLQDNRFGIRKKATDELEKLGELVEPALKKALEGNPPLDVKQAIEQLLKKLSGPVTHPDRLRALRAVEVLEQIATPEAQEVLRTIAQGAPEAQLTQDAQKALERLAGRK